jgi:ribosomal protein S12 methylthiotransferase accessory factor
LSSLVELRPVRPTPVATSLHKLRSFVSPLSGVVRATAETLAAPDEHRLISIGCELADGGPTIGSPVESYTGSEHWLRDAAEAAAIGEALERYAGSYVPTDRLVVASAEEVGPRAVEPERFALFSAAQHAEQGFPFHPFGRDTVVSWVEGFAIPGGEPAYLPAQLVYMPWRRQALAETRIGHATSSGLACAATLEEAVLTGLLELIERDAFMLVWHNRLSLALLDWSGDDDLLRLDRRYFAPTALSYSAVDLSVFLDVPTVLGVVHGARGRLGALGVGAASAPTVAVAWRKALAEAFSVQRWVRDQAFEQPERLGGNAAEIRTFDDHTLYYAGEERARRAAFLDGSAERRSTREITPLEGGNVLELIEGVARRLADRDIRAYAVDVTTPDVGSGGLRVVRLVVPELCPLDVVEGARFLGGRRMCEAAFEAGLVGRRLEPADLNPDPHPFP